MYRRAWHLYSTSVPRYHARYLYRCSDVPPSHRVHGCPSTSLHHGTRWLAVAIASNRDKITFYSPWPSGICELLVFPQGPTGSNRCVGYPPLFPVAGTPWLWVWRRRDRAAERVLFLGRAVQIAVRAVPRAVRRGAGLALGDVVPVGLEGWQCIGRSERTVTACLLNTVPIPTRPRITDLAVEPEHALARTGPRGGRTAGGLVAVRSRATPAHAAHFPRREVILALARDVVVGVSAAGNWLWPRRSAARSK